MPAPAPTKHGLDALTIGAPAKLLTGRLLCGGSWACPGLLPRTQAPDRPLQRHGNHARHTSQRPKLLFSAWHQRPRLIIGPSAPVRSRFFTASPDVRGRCGVLGFAPTCHSPRNPTRIRSATGPCRRADTVVGSVRLAMVLFRGADATPMAASASHPFGHRLPRQWKRHRVRVPAAGNQSRPYPSVASPTTARAQSTRSQFSSRNIGAMGLCTCPPLPLTSIRLRGGGSHGYNQRLPTTPVNVESAIHLSGTPIRQRHPFGWAAFGLSRKHGHG